VASRLAGAWIRRHSGGPRRPRRRSKPGGARGLAAPPRGTPTQPPGSVAEIARGVDVSRHEGTLPDGPGSRETPSCWRGGEAGRPRRFEEAPSHSSFMWGRGELPCSPEVRLSRSVEGWSAGRGIPPRGPGQGGAALPGFRVARLSPPSGSPRLQRPSLRPPSCAPPPSVSPAGASTFLEDRVRDDLWFRRPAGWPSAAAIACCSRRHDEPLRARGRASFESTIMGAGPA
jgi:hypothetical protein